MFRKATMGFPRVAFVGTRSECTIAKANLTYGPAARLPIKMGPRTITMQPTDSSSIKAVSEENDVYIFSIGVEFPEETDAARLLAAVSVPPEAACLLQDASVASWRMNAWHKDGSVSTLSWIAEGEEGEETIPSVHKQALLQKKVDTVTA